MDTNTINHVSLCSGYGGIDLGLKRAIGERLRTVAFVEVECFAVCNLAAKAEAKLLDSAPIWSDLRTFPWGKFHGLVDILSGGYPCQPFSAAGKRLGAEDPRHLWPFIAAGIAAMRPGVCFFENVEGHISLGLPDVLQDLAGMGYRTTWCVASASECGAPHQRKRIFILAECSSQRGASGLSRSLAGHEGIAGIADDCGDLAWPSRPGERQFAWEPPRVVADTKGKQRRLSSDSQSTAERWWSAQLGSADGAGAAETSTLADAKSQRANRRLDVCDEEWRPGPTLQPESDDTGREDATMDDASSLRSAEPADGSGQAAPWADASGDEAMGNAPQRQDHGPESRDMGFEAGQGRCGDHAVGSAGEVLGHAGSQRCEQAERDVRGEQQASGPAEECGLGVAEAMGHANSPRPQVRPRQRGAAIQGVDADGGEAAERQTQPSLGRDADGLTHRLDHAVLHVSTDNRTDELRLLGNGVCVPTVERAWRVLVGELAESEAQ